MYDILEAPNALQMKALVDAKEREGWTPVGGLSVCFCGNAQYRMFQAVVKEGLVKEPQQQKSKQS